MPTYTKPIDQLAAEDIYAAVAEISTDAGDAIDVKSVEWMNRIGTIPIDKHAMILQLDAEPIPNPALGHEEWWQPVEIWYYIVEPDDSNVPLELRMNLAAAAIEKKLLSETLRNGLPGYQRSGYALDTVSRPAKYAYDVSDQLVGVVVCVACHLRSLYGDRFST